MGTSALASLQKRFIRSVVSNELARPEGIIPGGSLSARAALEVYRRGYIVRLTEALGETYEAVWSVLGDEAFFRLCRDYIRAHPSASYNLADYGADFPEFLGRQEAEAEALPFLEDLGRFEWIFKELFHQAEHSRAEPSALNGIGSRSALRFGSAARLLSFRRPVYAVWCARGESGGPREAGRGPEYILLYKSGGEIYARLLLGAEFAVLSALSQGAGIESALASASAGHPDLTPERTSELFRWLWDSGVVCDVKEENRK